MNYKRTARAYAPLLRRYANAQAMPGKALAKIAMGRANKALKQLNSEKKYHDVTEADKAIAKDTPEIYVLNGIAQGDGEDQRVGFNVKATSLYWRINLTANGATNSNLCRILVVLDKQGDGSLPSVTDVLTATNVDAFRELKNAYRYKILYDRRVKVAPEGQTGDLVTLKGYTNFKYPVMVRYNADTTSVSSITTNPIYLIAFSDALSSGSPPVMDFISRFRYVDN